MTLVAALKLTPELGMGCSDERVTYATAADVRSYDLVEKLSSIGNYGFMGPSGSISFGTNIKDKLKERIKPDTSMEDIANIVRDLTIERRDEIVNTEVFRNYGVNEQEYKKKDPDINPDLRRRIDQEIVKTNNSIATSFIVAGYDSSKGFKIYGVPFCGEPLVGEDYQAIGSGADLARHVISDRLQRINPREKERIGMAKGCRILMEATRDSWHNFGVGGRTQVVWVGKDKHYNKLDYDESNMLQNLLYLERIDVIDTDFVDGMFKDVVENGAKYSDLRKNISRKILKDVLLDKFLIEGLHT